MPRYSGQRVRLVGCNTRGSSNSKIYVYCACLYNVILIGGYTVNKYKRLLQLVLLFAGGFVAGSLIAAVFTLGFRAITAV